MTPPELTERQAFMILNDLPNIGPITLNRLLEEFGRDPARILSAGRRQLESVQGVGPRPAPRYRAGPRTSTWRGRRSGCRKAGAAFVTTRDAGYPKLLKEIHDPPIGLVSQGWL